MSEQTINARPTARTQAFMVELDQWTEANIINPLVYVHAEDDDEDWRRCIEQIKKAVRSKVLESYRNGQAAGPRPQKGGR